jgi:hypothetical protein
MSTFDTNIKIMETIYKIKASELDIRFIESIKTLFADNEILISIVTTGKNKKLTVQYSKQILGALKNLESGKVVNLSGEEFDSLSKKMMNP